MTGYERYVFFLCLIVFVMLTGLFSYLITLVTKQQIKMIRHGLEDTEIKREYRKETANGCLWTAVSALFSALVCLALCAVFAFSVYLRATEDKAANGVPALRVVKSGSMSYAAEENIYLQENGLTDQLQTNDLIITRRMPDEMDLQLYDIVVYKKDDAYIIHRIVGIEEPNEKHPDVRHFLLQGDAVNAPDSFPVLYEQMRGIYLGERIPYVGSFILFMQSPAGWLCILLVIFAIFTTPIVEKKLEREKQTRWEILQLQLYDDLCEDEGAVAASTGGGARHG